MNITSTNANELSPSIQPIVGFIRHLNDNVFQEIVNSKISEEGRERCLFVISIDLGILRSFRWRIR